MAKIELAVDAVERLPNDTTTWPHDLMADGIRTDAAWPYRPPFSLT
jgi:hypothetical protein